MSGRAMANNFAFAPPPPAAPAPAPSPGAGSGLAAEQLVKALRQMPVEELRAQMPELEQILSTVRHQGGGAGGAGVGVGVGVGVGAAAGGGLLGDGGAAGTPVFGAAPGASAAWPGSAVGIHQAQAANALQQLSRGMEAGGAGAAPFGVAPVLGQGLGGAAGARPADPGMGAAGGACVSRARFCRLRLCVRAVHVAEGRRRRDRASPQQPEHTARSTRGEAAQHQNTNTRVRRPECGGGGLWGNHGDVARVGAARCARASRTSECYQQGDARHSFFCSVVAFVFSSTSTRRAAPVSEAHARMLV